MSWEHYWRRRWQQRHHPIASGTVVFPSVMRMYDVPTKFGWSIFLLLIVMFIWSANHQLNLGYALIALLFVFWLLGWIIVAEQLTDLHVTVSAGEAVFAGEEATFAIHLSETNGHARAGFFVRNDWQEQFCAELPAGETRTVTLGEPTTHRGWQQMHAFTVLSTFPAGAFMSWRWVHLRARVLVYPRPAGNLPLPWQLQTGSGSTAQHAAGEDEFSHLRPYQRGDALSRVAWKRYGRGELLLKTFAGEGIPRLRLDFATLGALPLEGKLSQLTQWILSAEAQGIAYALHLPNQQFPFGRGVAHRQRCLQALALFGQ